MHAGIRAPVIRRHGDLRNDVRCGFAIVHAREIDHGGVAGVVDAIRTRVGDSRVYVSVDIDVLDPAFAPGGWLAISANDGLLTLAATGTAEPGGWSTRELLAVLEGLEGLQVVGADVVEVAPIYDSAGETTGLAAAEAAKALVKLMVELPVKEDSAALG